jgi:adenosylcobinamide-phosphate synthase
LIEKDRLIAALLFDLIAGDPDYLPHPVRLIGSMVNKGEAIVRRYTSTPKHEVIGGAILSFFIITISYFSSFALIRLMKRIHPKLGIATEIILAWTTLAIRSLLSESSSVLNALNKGDIELARERLSMIVGRDTDNLDEQEILRAVIETVAESLCDGIISPLFYLTLGGVPLAFAYKAINTLDSMIGHKESPYLHFGRIAARTDDIANYLPARISALSIITTAGILRQDLRAAYQTWKRDADLHSSPNAGQSESAMAGGLHVRLGGLNYYDGDPHFRPYFGAEYNPPTPKKAYNCLRIALVASLIGGLVAATVCWIREKNSMTHL